MSAALKNNHHASAGRVGRLASRNPDDPELLAARADLAREKAARAVRRALADRPTFTVEQLAELSELLNACGAR